MADLGKVNSSRTNPSAAGTSGKSVDKKAVSASKDASVLSELANSKGKTQKRQLEAFQRILSDSSSISKEASNASKSESSGGLSGLLTSIGDWFGGGEEKPTASAPAPAKDSAGETIRAAEAKWKAAGNTGKFPTHLQVSALIDP